MATNVKDVARRALDRLTDVEAAEVLEFMHYLRWRREEADQSWFSDEEWQARYHEARADLAEGRFRDFDDVEDLLSEMKS